MINMITKFDKFVNESIKDSLKPKNKKDIINKFNNSNREEKNNLFYNLFFNDFDDDSDFFEFVVDNCDIEHDIDDVMDIFDIIDLISENELNYLFNKLLSYKFVNEKYDKFGDLKDAKSIEEISKLHKFDLKKLKEYLKVGIRIEREHTDDNEIAEKIALHHLEETPLYYHNKFGLPEMERRLEKMLEEEKEEERKKLE
ncbi:MAG: DUF5661 family protein [Bacilli bacterium]